MYGPYYYLIGTTWWCDGVRGDPPPADYLLVYEGEDGQSWRSPEWRARFRPDLLKPE